MASNSIWDYYSKVPGDGKFANCNQCSKELSYRTSITNLKTHLKLKHIGHYNSFLAENQSIRRRSVQLQNPRSPSQPVPSTSASQEVQLVPASSTFTHQVSHRSPSRAQGNILAYTRLQRPLRPDEKKHIDAMLLKLIAKTYQPFSIVEEPDFIEFVQALNPNYILPGRKVISERLIPFLYNRCLEDQKKMLHKEAKTICLTTDCWTSVKMDSFIGVTAHYINQEFDFKSVVLKCSEVNGAHSSQNLSEILRLTSSEWDISDKINFCVTDNAANIVGAIQILGWTHCGCIAHKLNLTLQHSLKYLDDTLKKVKKFEFKMPSEQQPQTSTLLCPLLQAQNIPIIF